MFFSINIPKKSKKIKTTTTEADYMQVIYPNQIADTNRPDFGIGKRKSEEEYKEFLEHFQTLTDEYEKTGSIHSLTYNSFEDIQKNEKEQYLLDVFKTVFIDIGQRVEVEKTLDGQYRTASNGWHRMYIAKKYNLKLLVHVCQEVKETTEKE